MLSSRQIFRYAVPARTVTEKALMLLHFETTAMQDQGQILVFNSAEISEKMDEMSA